MDSNNCQRCKKQFDSMKRIPKELQCGCIICTHCISKVIDYDGQFVCKAHKQAFEGKVSDLKDFVATESFQNQLKNFMEESKLDQHLQDFQQQFNTQQMRYIKQKKAILRVQNFFYNIIQQICQQETLNICEQLKEDLKQRAQIAADLRDQLLSLEEVKNQSSETRQQHEERIKMLNQVQGKLEIIKNQMFQVCKQVEPEEQNERELVLSLSESCFYAIKYIQEKTNCQVVEEKEVANLIALSLIQKEKYDYQVLSSERVQGFVKKISSQVVSVEKLRENPLNKSSICKNQSVINQFKLNQSQKLIEKLYEVVELSKQSQEIEQAAANGITILKNLNPNFSQKNFESIKIRGADLSDAIFQDCNFKNTNFQDVNLLNSKFNNCNCEGANLTNAVMEQLYQCTAITGHTSEIRSLVVSPDNQFIISGSGSPENSIKIWNFQEGTLLRTIQGHTSDVESVVISTDQK